MTALAMSLAAILPPLMATSAESPSRTVVATFTEHEIEHVGVSPNGVFVAVSTVYRETPPSYELASSAVLWGKISPDMGVELLMRYPGHRITALHICDAGDAVIIASSDERVNSVPTDGEALRWPWTISGSATRCIWSSNCSKRAILGEQDPGQDPGHGGWVREVEFPSVGEPRTLAKRPGTPSAIAEDAMNGRVAIGYETGGAEVVELASGRRIQGFDRVTPDGQDIRDAVASVCFVDMGKKLIVAGGCGFTVWDVDNRRVVAEVYNPELFVMRCQYCASADVIVTADGARRPDVPSPRGERMSLWRLRGEKVVKVGSIEREFTVVDFASMARLAVLAHGRRLEVLEYEITE